MTDGLTPSPWLPPAFIRLGRLSVCDPPRIHRSFRPNFCLGARGQREPITRKIRHIGSSLSSSDRFGKTSTFDAPTFVSTPSTNLLQLQIYQTNPLRLFVISFFSSFSCRPQVQTVTSSLLNILSIMRVSSALLQVVLLWASTLSSSAFAPSSTRRFASSTSSSLNSKYKVFIDGEAGTTGLQVRGRIEARDDLEIISPPDELRKDEETRKALINEADVVILCT
jgi:hypothetical protein